MVAAAVLAVGGPLPASRAAGPLVDECLHTGEAGVATFVGTTSHTWDDTNNWDVHQVPGLVPNAYAVCIPAGKSVQLDFLDLQTTPTIKITALTIAPTARLTILPGGRLELTADPATALSVVQRSGARVGTLDLTGVLAGRGTLKIDGVTTWRHVTAASTMTTEYCDDQPPGNPTQRSFHCNLGTPAGTTVVGPGGRLAVQSAGVNLWDRRHLEVQGLFVIGASPAYVAADHDTSMHVAVGGELQFKGDGDIYEGHIASDGLSNQEFVLDNEGTVRKYAGTGLSVLSADYGTAALTRIVDGTLAIGDQTEPTAPSARVRHGESYAIGTCPEPGPGDPPCGTPDPATLPGAAGSVRVTLPATTTSYAGVELTAEGAKADGLDLINPLHIAATGVTATRTAPMVFRFRIDSVERGARTVRSILIYRKADSATMYSVIGPCTSVGALVAPRLACVDRRATQSRILADGDALIVVRSIVNSRWVGR